MKYGPVAERHLIEMRGENMIKMWLAILDALARLWLPVQPHPLSFPQSSVQALPGGIEAQLAERSGRPCDTAGTPGAAGATGNHSARRRRCRPR